MDDRLNEKLDIISKEIEYKIWRNLEDKYNKLRGNVYSFIDGHIDDIRVDYGNLSDVISIIEKKLDSIESRLDNIEGLLDNTIKKEEIHYKDLNKLNESLYREMDDKIKKTTLKKKTTSLMKARLLKLEKKLK
tara:strand:- start:4553 stop:4951 length:399 start_codon:yes stop_codon:yes gene_type:complete